MPVIDTSGWTHDAPPKPVIVDCVGGVRLPVFARTFAAPNAGYVLAYPSGYLSPDLWKLWVRTCQRYATFDPTNKRWVFSAAVLARVSVDNAAAAPAYAASSKLTKEERVKLKAERAEAEEKFNEQLTELSKEENVPEHLWPTYQYPPHYSPPAQCLTPTALQRIVVSRYWNQPYALIAASVGTGKSRMTVDMLASRATAAAKGLQDSARIVLIVAPLALHENWRREFVKWSPPGARIHWDVHIYTGTADFWADAEKAASKMFDVEPMVAGGQVIIVTPNALSRDRLPSQLVEYGWVPTAIVVDECQRFFRKPQNKAYKTLREMRKNAHIFLGLSGTPTSKFEDWWALEELMAGNEAQALHWRGGTYLDYQRLGDKETMAQSGLFTPGWSFERAIKEFHAQRIRKGRVFVADKFYYMKDSLPGLGQEELGEFADLRLSFSTLFDEYPQQVEAAHNLQLLQSGETKFKGDERMFATTLMLRMRQIAAMSPANEGLLREFVTEFLDDNEPAVFWIEFRNDPAKQLDATLDILNTFGPTAYVAGGMEAAHRQEAIDGFQSGKYRFLCCQYDAGGVGLTLTRACKNLFLTIPLGYQAVCQAIGRLHRIGQLNDVMTYFCMSHPIAAFARYLYDNRKELNEVIPQKYAGIVPKGIYVPALDTEPALH